MSIFCHTCKGGTLTPFSPQVCFLHLLCPCHISSHPPSFLNSNRFSSPSHLFSSHISPPIFSLPIFPPPIFCLPYVFSTPIFFPPILFLPLTLLIADSTSSIPPLSPTNPRLLKAFIKSLNTQKTSSKSKHPGVAVSSYCKFHG